MGWSELAGKAQKILGPKAVIPKPKPEVVQVSHDLDAAYGQYLDAHRALDDAIKTLRKVSSAYRGALKQLHGAVEKADFGIDSRDAENRKKIGQAATVLADWIDAQMDLAEKDDKRLDDLRQHLEGLGKYARPAAG